MQFHYFVSNKKTCWKPQQNISSFVVRCMIWLKPATLLKLTLLHGCFSRFLICTNNTKSRNASRMFPSYKNHSKSQVTGFWCYGSVVLLFSSSSKVFSWSNNILESKSEIFWKKITAKMWKRDWKCQWRSLCKIYYS